ncbi:response regulator [Spirosoma sp. HMF3257]|uniref:Response regulator n=1 Tax=Spirosoma telluris TaxID=2183553 RepID=A0A327NI81_9BACT|nr:response regulator [Spirosoma telluris]RAI74535.1 response regulator [Spirosoma telluris]
MLNVPTSFSSKSPKATILVIEDNADQWFIIHWALLQRFPEVEAIWMQEPTQAMMYLEACMQDIRELPKLILLDLYLPLRQHGWNLLELIKAHSVFREIPVVILSQSNDPEDIAESYTLRSNSYIVKPSGYEKWLACIASFRHYWWESVTLPKFS